jgi:hypothetical protein
MTSTLRQIRIGERIERDMIAVREQVTVPKPSHRVAVPANSHFRSAKVRT